MNSIVYWLSTERNNFQTATKRRILTLLGNKTRLRLTAGDLRTKSPSISSIDLFLQTLNAPIESNSVRTSRRRMFSDVGARVHTYTRQFTVPTWRPQWVFVRPSQTILLRFVIMLMDYKESFDSSEKQDLSFFSSLSVRPTCQGIIALWRAWDCV